MKTMTCKQLGGSCEKEFHANSFEEMADLSKQHGLTMFQKGDGDHLEAMKKIMVIMQDPHAMQKWMKDRKEEFDALPENE